ncbi:MAG: 50S ribosomal protein L10 [Candidatus Pacearchaeota archaeon]|jgi:large subunit ribosomal protein L10
MKTKSKKTVAEIPKAKLKTVKELTDLIKNKKTVLIASIKNLPGSQFQEISKKLRGKAIVKVPKKSLIYRAIDESENEELKKLKEQIGDSVAVLFSDLDSYELAGELMENKSPAKAKVGQIAPSDIEVEAGPTDLVPGPAISELGSVGLQVQVENGKLTIRESRVIVKVGEKIKENAADVMSKLDIKPFSIGFIPVCTFDIKDSKLYLEIKIDKEGTLKNLKEAYGRALPFAVSVGYLSKDTIGFILQKASAHANKLNRIMTGEPEPVAETAVEETKEESPKEEKKEEPKADVAEGLASLFG